MTAASTLVGQNLGAKRIEHSKRAAKYCLIGSLAISVLLGACIWLWPDWFVRLSIATPAGPVAAAALRTLAVGLPAFGVAFTLVGVLSGAGDTKVPMWCALISGYLIRLPLAIFLSHNGFSYLNITPGVEGIWYAMVVSLYVEMLLLYWRYASGRWTKAKLHLS
jgi:Na+-driven multidrug efflux pump